MKINQYEATPLNSTEKLVGGVCEFYDKKKKEKVFLMLHKNSDDKPTVTRVSEESLRSTFDCWEWMFNWLKAYEESGDYFKLQQFKDWLNNQMMCEEKP